MRLSSQPFGKTADGIDVQVHVLSDDRGTTVRLIDYGASVISLRTPDRDGNSDEVTLGYGTLPSYEADKMFLGRTVGRYANRIAHGRFSLGGQDYQLPLNANLINHIHGGPDGLHSVVWSAEPFENEDDVGVVFTHKSPDGAGGYPGTLDLAVTYTLSKDRELRIFETATTDRATILNLTNHTYFNLGSGPTILDHRVSIDADLFIPISAYGIPIAGPTGVLHEMDIRDEALIGERVGSDNDHLKRLKGFDHTYVINQTGNPYDYPVTIKAPSTGRWLSVQTSKPGVRFYTGNNLADTKWGPHGGLCLETMHFEDSPNRPEFPTTVITPEQPYGHSTLYSFGAS